MIMLTASFDIDWLESKKANGLRVVREVENWILGVKGVTLKKVTFCSVTVTMDSGCRAMFEEGIAKKLVNDYQVEDVSKVVTYKLEECEEGETKKVDTPSADEIDLSGVGKSAPLDKKSEAIEEISPSETLEDILREPPFKYSRELQAYMNEINQVIPMLKEFGEMSSFWRRCLLLGIDDGYGQTDFLNGLGRLYSILGIAKRVLGKNAIREIKVKKGGQDETLYSGWESALDAAKSTQSDNEKNEGSKPILCLDIGAWQDKLHTKEVKGYLRKLNANSNNYTLIFRVPFVEARVLSAVAEALNDIFNIRTLVVPPPTVTVLTDYAREQFSNRGFELETGAGEVIEKRLIEEKCDDSFFGYKTVNKVVDSIIYDKALINCRAGKKDRTISACDIASGMVGNEQNETAPHIEMNSLIGLDSVKQKVLEIVSQIKFQRKLAAQGKKIAPPTIHMVFSGNPGTGKTTLARIVGRIFREEGLLRKGHLIEVKGRDLCGQYVGQTAPKTSAICRDAYGSVLFIDEAYSLFRGDEMHSNDYGREALDTLIAEMENHRDDMCVILAGYSDEMNTMIQGNPGMDSRIPFKIEFPNYSRTELGDIFFAMLNNNFNYEEGLKDAVYEFFDKIPNDVFEEKGFSNARFVRNLYERTWGRAAYRSRLEEGDIKILVSDLSGAAEEREFKKLVERNVRKSIGFDSWLDEK